MNSQRIEILKQRVALKTEEIASYKVIQDKIYDKPFTGNEADRRADFLMAYAQEVPVVMHEEELLVGSMRFWGCPRSAAFVPNAGHIIVDYGMVLREGIDGIKEKISKLNTEDSSAFMTAVSAFGEYIERHAKQAAKLYESTGRKEMKTVSENCFHLCRYPAENFAQALQMVWFVHVFLHVEGMSAAVSYGRFDKTLGAYYEKDIEQGSLTREEAKELLKCFWLKNCEGDESQNLIVGGDYESDFSFLCLEVTEELKVKQPSLSVRIGSATTPAFWEAVTRVVKTGIGMPAIFNDQVVTKALEYTGFDEKTAADYGIVGCYEAVPNTDTYGMTVHGPVHLFTILQEYMYSGKEYTDFETFYNDFKEFLVAYYKNVHHPEFIKRCAFHAEKCCSPFQAVCIESCLESGLCAEKKGTKYKMFGVNILGIGTLIDSMYAVKEIVFEQKLCSYPDFVEQVKNEFPNKEMEIRCKNLPGKYGTDNEVTNAMAADLSAFLASMVVENPFDKDIKADPALFQFGADIHLASAPATPDGRRSGERISYGISASDYSVGKTITSVMNSASNIICSRFSCGTPLLIYLPSSYSKGENGDELIPSMTKTYFEKGGFVVQYNTVGADIMRSAQEEPDKYKDLLVRISGFSAQFISLSKAIQEAVIHRTLTQET